MNKKDLKELVQLLESNNIGEKFIKKINKELKPISVSSRKQKGRTLQKKVCSMISECIEIPYDQSDDNCLIHSREMGQHGTDVILRGEAREKFPFSIECKNQEKLNLYSAIEQAKSNLGKDLDWIVIHKRNKSGIYCTLEFESFLKFFEKVIDNN